ncbi:hypothetical protein BH24CHL7_BH24CHL7_05810 [soil metagenome]
MATVRTLALAAALVVVLGACAATGPGASPTAQTPAAAPTAAEASPTEAPASPTEAPASPTEAPASPTDTAEPTDAASPSAAASPAAEICPREELTLKTLDRLTLSTDIPAYPPWWGGDPEEQYPNEPEGGSGWELSDPYSMEGYESATAYAIAEAMGFAADEVDWVQNSVFEQAFAPGEKPFDFHMAQISIRPERAEAVDFSDPYFDSYQSVLALTPNEITGATSIADLQGYRLGAAANTTSFDLIEDVIQPTTQIMVYPDNATALQALQGDAIDGLVVDIQTAIFMRDAQLEDFDTPDPEATVVAQFDVTSQTDQMGIVLEKDSPLTACVNAAIAQIRADGTLEEIYNQWIVTGQEIPFFEE